MRFNISHKIFAIVLVLLVLLLAVALYSIHLTARIADDLDIVVGKHLPVSDTVTRINVHILTQGVLLQRLLVLEDAEAPVKRLAHAKARLAALGEEIEAEFAAAAGLLRAEEKAVATRPQALDAIVALEKSLAGIKQEYQSFEAHSGELLAAHQAGDRALFAALLADLNQRQDAVDEHIAALRRHIEAATGAAVVRAERDEKYLLAANSVLTALAALLGLGFATLIARAIVRSLRNLVAGAAAVEAGNLDTEIAVASTDEVGQLTGAFNHMVGELRMKERIKDTFGKYMDPRIVAGLLEAPEFAQPGGERREMTVMFIDLKGFTSISEALAPADLVTMVNRFFGHMTEAIAQNKGVVDKFMGDAVMAYWGPPFTGAGEHAALACRAAWQALEQLEKFREDVRRELGARADDLDLDLRIGVSTGEMIVGTVGSSASMSFTIMGDPVNLGARLEGANKAYGTRVMISERTKELAGEAIQARELDIIRVKGKVEPTTVYQLLDATAEAGRDLPAPVQLLFQTGIEAYRRQNWDEAAAAFEGCLSGGADDPAATVYLERIARLRAEPPGAGWDGVWEFRSK